MVKSTTPGLISKIPNVNREKIRDSWTICDLIGKKNDTISDWPDCEAEIETKTNHKALWVKENLTSKYIKDALKITRQPNLLSHLSTALDAHDADFWLKLFRSVIHKLSFESFLFSTIGPTYPLHYIHSTTQSGEPPSYNLPKLQLKKHELKWTLRVSIHTSLVLCWNSNHIFERCDYICAAVKRIRTCVIAGWCALRLSNTSCLTRVTNNHTSQ